jgi:hypothetical protein
MKKSLQTFLDWCYYARRDFATSIAFITLRVYGREVEYSEVKAGTFDSRQHTPLSLEEAKDIDLLFDLSKEDLANAEKRRSVITDKCKTLLTLGSLLFGVIGLLLPKYLAFDSLWMRGLSALALAILFNAIVLLLMFFDVGKEMEVSLTQDEIPLDPPNLKKSLLNQNRKCVAASENRTDYLVELYLAARFCFLSALTIVAGLVLTSVVMNSPRDQTEHIVRELRTDPTLTNLLRGPKGDNGAKGDRGDQGIEGKQGLKGERGNNSHPNDVASALLLDAKFREMIDKAVESQNKAPAKP